MKIGIVTYVKCDNYGAELQAFAMQYIYNKAGYDAEILDLEKQAKDISSSASTILPAIVNRIKVYGWKAPIKIIALAIDVLNRKRAKKKYSVEIMNKHQLFEDFFNSYIKHSDKYYTLESVYTEDFKYDAFVAGSDQIWNYMHTDYLDVYFLMFANRLHAKKVSYAASISVPDIPINMRSKYKELFENMDSIGVRELNGKEIVEKYSSKKATVVLDPTLLVTKSEWIESGVANQILKGKRYVLIYTLSGSTYIKTLAKTIAKKLGGIEVVNIKSNFIPEKDRGITHLYNVGPREWVGLIMNASYMVTDSFHGSAFSINFNVPFTTLLNPSSNMNSRALSILKIAGLENRIIYDNGDNLIPDDFSVDYGKVNPIIEEWREKSWIYLKSSLDR